MQAERRRRTRRQVAWLALLLLFGGLEAGATESEVLAGNASDAILVLPLNVVSQMPPELADASPIIWDDLTDYLQDRDRRLKTARMSDARDLWRGSIRAVRERGDAARADFDAALEQLVTSLSGHADFATVLVPSLLLRQAPVRDRRAEWDGVSESVEFRADSPETRRLALLMRFEGLAPAASLHVVILDAEGRKLHESVRGIELIASVRVQEDPQEPFVYEYRRDLFQDPERVREEVARALVPFIALPSSAE